MWDMLLTLFFLSQIQQPSTASSLSRHHSSASTSSASARTPGSFAHSVGSGLARSGSMIARSQTSMSFHQSTNPRQRANTARSLRPQTSMANRNVEEEPPTGKQNCMMPPPSSGSLQYSTIRKAASLQSMGRQADSAPKRDISISTMMGKLSLNDERAYGSLSKRNRVVSARENRSSAPTPISLRPSSDHLGNVPLRGSRRQEAAVEPAARHSDSRASNVAPPKTPRPTDHAQQALEEFGEVLASTRKGSPTKSPSKVRPFLTKDSNLRTFTAWDMDERLIEVEAQFKTMKEVMNTSLTDKKAMEGAIEMAKTRGESKRQGRIGGLVLRPQTNVLQLMNWSAIATGWTRGT